MSKPMRAKLQLQSVMQYRGPDGKPHESESLSFSGVSGKFGPNGESEDNTFARYSPMVELKMTVSNPALLGVYRPGQKFYVDFTPVED